MLKFYGADLSSPANKVRFVLHALGREYEYIRVRIKEKENRTESFLKLHPAGKIPVIDDEGFVLFESDVIIKYLAKKAASDLYPQEVNQQAIVDQWMSFVSVHINAAMGRVLFNRVFAPFAKVAVDERSLQDGETFLKKFLPIVDSQLSQYAFLVGDNLSLADMTLLATLDPAEICGIDLSVYKNISLWRQKAQAQEYYTKCYQRYGEVLFKMREK